MKTIEKLKLNRLGKAELENREMDVLLGKGSCPTTCGTCGCLYEGTPGGSTTYYNDLANKDGDLHSPCVDDYDPYC
jgi:natural product precursor